MRGLLTMSGKERSRLLVCTRVLDQHMSLKAASGVLNISYRQMRRVFRRFATEGDVGLVHRSRGRSSNRGYDPEFKAAVLVRYQERYDGFGPTLAAEKLVEDGLALDHKTLRRWLLAAGIAKKRRKRPVHRAARPRKAHFGQLVQLDGSPHAWFEDRAPSSCLMEMIDDATGTRLAFVCEAETTADAMRILKGWIERYGVPEALYTDRHTIYVTDREPTIQEQLDGDEPLSAFGTACADLGIVIIPAGSPQAKGRVERAHGLLQDRYVKELRLEEASTIDEANRMLADGFTDDINTKFAVAPAKAEDRHRPVRRDEDLAQILSLKQTRTVANDFTIRHDRRILQIDKQRGLPRPESTVTVARYLDGSLHVLSDGNELAYTDVTDKLRTQIASQPKTITPQRYAKPAADHPWRKSANKRLAVKAAIACKARH